MLKNIKVFKNTELIKLSFLSLEKNKGGLFFKLIKDDKVFIYFAKTSIISFQNNLNLIFDSKLKLNFFLNQFNKGLKQLIYGYYIEVLL